MVGKVSATSENRRYRIGNASSLKVATVFKQIVTVLLFVLPSFFIPLIKDGTLLYKSYKFFNNLRYLFINQL